MAALKVDDATRAALQSGDLRAAVRALQQANPGLKLEDLPAAMKAVRALVDDTRTGGIFATAARAAKSARETTAQEAAKAGAASGTFAAHAVQATQAARKSAPTVSPGDGGSLGAMRLLAILTVGAVLAGLWWMAGGG